MQARPAGRSLRGRIACTAVLLAGALACAGAAAAGVVIFQDDFEDGNTNGWLFTQEGGSGLQGAWVIGNPNGTFDPSTSQPAQPEDAFAGLGCAFTGQNASLGEGDVDDGAVYLVSPPMDLSAASTAQLRYVRWFYNATLNNDPGGDFFVVQARPDAASPWVDVEHLNDTQSVNEWTPRVVQLETYVALASSVQIRFGASDRGPPFPFDIIEAAVDEVTITVDVDCTTNADCLAGEFCDGGGSCVAYGDGDFDGDADIDLLDCRAFQACFGSAGVGACGAGNMTGSEVVDAEDYAAFAAALGGPQ